MGKKRKKGEEEGSSSSKNKVYITLKDEKTVKRKTLKRIKDRYDFPVPHAHKKACDCFGINSGAFDIHKYSELKNKTLIRDIKVWR